MSLDLVPSDDNNLNRKKVSNFCPPMDLARQKGRVYSTFIKKQIRIVRQWQRNPRKGVLLGLRLLTNNGRNNVVVGRPAEHRLGGDVSALSVHRI